MSKLFYLHMTVTQNRTKTTCIPELKPKTAQKPNSFLEDMQQLARKNALGGSQNGLLEDALLLGLLKLRGERGHYGSALELVGGGETSILGCPRASEH